MAVGSEVTDWSKVEHHTRLDDIAVFSWVQLNATTEVTRLPLWDLRHDLFARITYREADEFATSIGARLISRDELEELRRIAIIIEPVTLPATAAMSSIEWSRRHDQEAIRRLSLVDNFGSPILGLGKHWLGDGVPPGRAHLMGWWTEKLQRYTPKRQGAGWIQQGAAPGSPGPHDWNHRDYGTTTMLVRDAA